MDDHNNSQNDHKSGDSESISTENAVVGGNYDPEKWSGPPVRDARTGRFIAGTGSSLRGGRPVGARDKITTTMIQLAEETAREHGKDMFQRLAKTDPAACLALITRLLPNADLSKAIQGGEDSEGATITQIDISITPGPAVKRIETISNERLQDEQRGLYQSGSRPLANIDSDAEKRPYEGVSEAYNADPIPTHRADDKTPENPAPTGAERPKRGIAPSVYRRNRGESDTFDTLVSDRDDDALRELYDPDAYL